MANSFMYSFAHSSLPLILIIIVAAGGLAFIPASIARRKGYSFVGFWFFGFAIFIAAIIVAACLPSKSIQAPAQRASEDARKLSSEQAVAHGSGRSAADELEKLQQLRDQGTLTEEEFLSAKERILKRL